MARQFLTPARIVTGRGAILEAASYIDGFGKKALIVCDQVMERIGKVKSITQALSKKGIAHAVFHDFTGEPDTAMVEAALSVYRKEGCDFLIGIGGGSTLDIMKAVAALEAVDGSVSDYVGKEITAVRAKMVAIPTSAGGGSEATQFAVIADNNTSELLQLRGEGLIPDVAIVDPELTLTLPRKITAYTGIDALTNALEAYTSREAQPLTDTQAISATRRIFHYLPLAIHDGNNEVARTQLSIAALEAGIALNNSSDTLVHGMSRPLGVLFHVPYDIANGMLLHVCLEYAKDKAIDKFADMARATGAANDGDSDEKAAEIFLSEIKKLCNVCQIPTLASYGIEKDVFFARIDEMAQAAMKSGCTANTIREVDLEVVKDLYKKLY